MGVLLAPNQQHPRDPCQSFAVPRAGRGLILSGCTVEDMSGPTQTCTECGRRVDVVPDGRGFPPDIAKRKLAKICREAGHKSRPEYRAGFTFGGPARGQSNT